jgi:hypothetical protein
LIAQVLTWQITVAEETEVVSHNVQVRAMQNRMLHELGDERDLKQWLVRSGWRAASSPSRSAGRPRP